MSACRFSLNVRRFSASLALLAAAVTARADENTEFFEARVRPILHKRCVSCHGEAKQQGDIRLDLRAQVIGLKGDDGLVTPGKPDDSRLIQVIRHSPDDTQMPPDQKLPDEEINILIEWVRLGAAWPESDVPAATQGGIPKRPDGSIDFVAAAAGHWAYQPVQHPTPPGVAAAEKLAPVDRFIRAQLESKGLSPSERADRRTLIRRATFDLLGVPPTYEEVEAFAADDSPEAWPRLIDRLLASPLYGERWGRHWLDIARYADTKGYVFTDNPAYPYAYTYRDYVVNAFNDDKPFDRFLIEQLAADHLGLPANDPALAAVGFLTVGPRFLNREPDIIDDRIDVVTRGLMGMTVACARCHDHKYDPIPTADYYSLYGIFASSVEPNPPPLIGETPDTPAYHAFQKELEKRQQDITDYTNEARETLLKQARERAGDYLLALAVDGRKGLEFKYEHGTPRDKLKALWKGLIDQRVKANDPLFRPWKALISLPQEDFAARAGEQIGKHLADESLDERERIVWTALRQRPNNSPIDLAAAYALLLKTAEQETPALPGEEVPTPLPESVVTALKGVVTGPGSVTDIGDNNERVFERDNHDKLRQLRRKVDEWQTQSPDAPPRAMVMVDREKPNEPVIFQRGDPARRGDRVPRQPPRILTGGESRPVQGESGRLALARQIASTDNPLTARVLVNRVWEWHFGKGLVGTSGDFGARSEPPTHPELLDWLAWTFMHEDGWSLKGLHRRIMLSATYQQSSGDREEARRVDSENQLYWRMNRRRLEFEPMRDSLLAVSGNLDTALGGRPVDIEKPPYSHRRTLYAKIDRNNFSPLLRTFDYPSPDATSPGRPLTTVPQQALFALNSEFLQTMAKDAAARAKSQAKEPESKAAVVDSLYRLVLSRNPSVEERTLFVEYLEQNPDSLDQLAQALLLTNEFLFID